MTEYRVVDGLEIVKAICDTIGINWRKVYGFDFHASVDEPVTIKVKMYGDELVEGFDWSSIELEKVS